MIRMGCSHYRVAQDKTENFWKRLKGYGHTNYVLTVFIAIILKLKKSIPYNKNNQKWFSSYLKIVLVRAISF